ncbi:MAG: radical SAM protein [Nanoarchaeota archaeon]|nr:radical SAM protein [Nanoarchaeota archaeon]
MASYKEINKWPRRWNFWQEILKRRDLSFAMYRLKWELATKFKYLLSFPVHIDLEINSNCNYKCIFCPHGTGEMRNDMPIMSLDTAKRILDELAKNRVYSIKLNWRGEPALHPNLAEITDYAKKAGIKEVQINTNGFAFNEQKIRDLVKAGIDRVIFSIDATTPELYAKIRIGGDFNRVVNNIKTFDRFRKELKQTKPFIRVQMVRTELNKHQVEDYKKMWQGIADDIRISDVTNRGQGDSLGVGDQVSIGRTCCPQPWQRMMISCEGKVLMCCSDWFEKYPLGDINKNSLKEIWQGEKLKAVRKLLKKVKYDFEPCKNCWVKESYIWQKVK